MKLSEIRDKKCQEYADQAYGDVNTKSVAKLGYMYGFDAGVAEYSKLLKDKVEYHAQAYGTDIFEEHGKSVDAIAAKMGRHMCKVFLEYIEECKL